MNTPLSESRTPEASKMELFVIVVYGYQTLTFAKISMLQEP